ncbi:hypothetical protein COP2_032834 [Malus domestica]
MLWYISIQAAATMLSGLHNNNYLNIRKKSNKQNDYLPLKREVRSLESNNQNVDSEKLENFHAKKAAFLRDGEELQSHRRVVVEDFQDAEALCKLASSEEHGWKVEFLINDDNSGNFKREVEGGDRGYSRKGKSAQGALGHSREEKEEVLKQAALSKSAILNILN